MASSSEKASALAPSTLYDGAYQGLLMRIGKDNQAEAFLQRLGDGQAYGAPMALAIFYFYSGELDKTADWLEKAIDQRYPLVPGLLRGPLGLALRQTPRWAELLKRVGLSELG